MKKAKASKLSLMARQNMKGYLFTAPVLIGTLFLFVPMLAFSLYYSFCDLSGGTVSFVGLANFSRAFNIDTQYRSLLLNTTTSMLIDTIVIMMFSFFIANILNQKFWGRSFARTVFFLPVILATGIIAATESETRAGYQSAFAAMEIYGSNTGGEVLSAFGGGSVFDLEALLLKANLNPTITNTIVGAVNNTYNIVNSSGVQILIFIAALQSIPQSVFEASKVEGATKWEEFWKITFPMMTPTIYLAMIYTIVDSFTRPSYGMMSYIESEAFFYGRQGYANAISVLYMLVMLAVIVLITLGMRRRIYYET